MNSIFNKLNKFSNSVKDSNLNSDSDSDLDNSYDSENSSDFVSDSDSDSCSNASLSDLDTDSDLDSDFDSESNLNLERKEFDPEPKNLNKNIIHCQVISKILPNKNQMCKNPVKFEGAYYCNEHSKYSTHEQEFFDYFLKWFNYDPTIQFEVLPESIKKDLYNYYIKKSNQLARVLETPKQFFYVTKNKKDTPYKEFWYKPKKSKYFRKDKINTINLLYSVSDILISKNIYIKYRRLTKEFRKKHNIQDISYEQWNLNKN